MRGMKNKGRRYLYGHYMEEAQRVGGRINGELGPANRLRDSTEVYFRS